MFIHCENTDCQFYWEDSCTKNLENKMVSIDCFGVCRDFKFGISDYYEEGENNE